MRESLLASIILESLTNACHFRHQKIARRCCPDRRRPRASSTGRVADVQPHAHLRTIRTASGNQFAHAEIVEWHMREAWREPMFADEDLERKKHRDPVAAAERSEAALDKVATRKLKDGSPVHSFRTLLDELSTIVRNTCGARVGQRSGSTFQMTTMPSPAQQRAIQLLQSITV
jgi:hypothetical protein